MQSEVFSKNLYRYRVQQKLTQREVADRIGVRQQTVAAWEANRSTPAPHIICDLARIFGISTDELLVEDTSLQLDWPKQRSLIPVLSAKLTNTISPFAKENAANYVEFLGSYHKRYFAVVMKDASMQPMLAENDIAIFEILQVTFDTYEEGIYALLNENAELSVRKIICQGGGKIIVPLNSVNDTAIYMSDMDFAQKIRVIGALNCSIRKW